MAVSDRESTTAAFGAFATCRDAFSRTVRKPSKLGRSVATLASKLVMRTRALAIPFVQANFVVNVPLPVPGFRACREGVEVPRNWEHWLSSVLGWMSMGGLGHGHGHGGIAIQLNEGDTHNAG